MKVLTKYDVRVGWCGGKDREGYIVIRLKGKGYRAHRLAWLFIYREMPNCPIDHINRIKDDNRIENLREATDSQNAMNTSLSKANTSGYRGVYYCNYTNKWRAECYCKKKKYHLGYFEYKETAYDVYCKFGEFIFGEFFDEGINRVQAKL